MTKKVPSVPGLDNAAGLASLRLTFRPADDVYKARVLDAWMPRCTTDFVLYKAADATMGNPARILLITRVGGYWPDVQWFFGGGQKLGEAMPQALVRLAMAEAGVNFDEHCFSVIGDVNRPVVQDTYNPANVAENKDACHTSMHVHAIHVPEEFEPRLDSRSRDPRWYALNALPTDLPEPVRLSLCKLFPGQTNLE